MPESREVLKERRLKLRELSKLGHLVHQAVVDGDLSLLKEVLPKYEDALYHLYHAYRDSCGPPMVKLASLEVGDVWFYDGLSATITACVGARSLLVTYGVARTREALEAEFRAGYEWLCDDRREREPDVPWVFAAREGPSGELVVRRFSGTGDWAGLPINVPLPPPEHERPPGWKIGE